MLVGGCNIDLVIAREAIHKRVNFTSCALVNKLIDEGRREVILRIGTIDITVINTDSNSALLFVHRNYIRDPIRQWNGVNETSLEKLFDFCFDGCGLSGVHRA